MESAASSWQRPTSLWQLNTKAAVGGAMAANCYVPYTVSIVLSGPKRVQSIFSLPALGKAVMTVVDNEGNLLD